MNSESVDLIYLDPPFNSNANYAAPIGSQAAGAEFKDMWSLSDIDAEWIELIETRHPQLWRVILAAMTDSDKSYLAYMAARLLEMPRLLKRTGSIYLHCDPKMSHYLKLAMDAIFGRDNFRNEIIWGYAPTGNAPKYGFPRKHDTILFYSKELDRNRWHQPHTEMNTRTRSTYKNVDEDGRLYKIAQNGKRTYLDEQEGRKVPSWWADIPSRATTTNSKEWTGFNTQKPIKLLDRIVSASSNEGDTVLDPFCGCATTCVSAEMLGRDWIGIDLSPKATELVNNRLRESMGSLFHDRLVTSRSDIPQRTDLGPLPRYNSREVKQQLYGQQTGHCAGCREHFELRHLEVDHIIARSKGGTDHLSNLQLLCASCNRIKGNRGMEYLRSKLQLVTAA